MITADASSTPLDAVNAVPFPAFPRIRLARIEELEPLMAMCRKLHDENGIGPAMDEDMVRREVMAIFAGMGAAAGEAGSRRMGYIFVIGDGGRIEGSLALIATRLWYADYWWLEDRWCFVLPEFRRSDNAKQLLVFAKHLAGRMGLPLMMSLISNERTEAKIRIYRRELGPEAGAFFLCGARTGKH